MLVSAGRLKTLGPIMEDSKQKIRTFLNRIAHNHEIGDDEDIFAFGYVNSMFAMELIQFVESEFSITIEDSDLDFDNFRTLNSIADLIQRKTSTEVPTGSQI